MPTVVNGLPAHVLLVHFAVVLIPATAFLLILSVVVARCPGTHRGLRTTARTGHGVFVQVTANAGAWFRGQALKNRSVRSRRSTITPRSARR